MKNICIIGGGPIGLNAYIKLSKHPYNVTLFESDSILGGQLKKIYPSKEIVDIAGISSIIASDYIDKLIHEIDSKDIHLNEKINIISKKGNGFLVTSSKSEYIFDCVIIATGLGSSTPRPLGLENEDKCKNILYTLDTDIDFTNKNIAIFGGGDSALDWSKHLDSSAKHIYLVHRRDEFRGNADTIKTCKNVEVQLSYIPFKININKDKASSIEIKSVKDETIKKLEIDFILVNFGNIPVINKFLFKEDSTSAFFEVKNSCETSIKNIFVVGDSANYEGKKRRIQPGINEVEEMVKKITQEL